jgi:eukaryotic-like serine/threonine-protein kinase
MPDQTLAGFRLVRKLGSGSRADVYLGHAGGAEPRTAAIKLFHPEVPLASIDAELRALGAASHAHTVQLRDLSGGLDGRPVLVLERLELGSLAQLLAQRGQLSAGEAVTILAPLAAAVTAMQASGVIHGAITAGRVLFRESGAPVLSGFGHAVVGAPSDVGPSGVDRRAVDPGDVDPSDVDPSDVDPTDVDPTDVDRRALAALAASVLDRLAPSDQQGPAVDLRQWLGSLVRYPDSFAAQLSQRLFALGEASPVRFTPDQAVVDGVPPRTTIAEPVIEPVEPPAARWFESYWARVPERFRSVKWLAVAAGALTVLIGLVAVPSGGRAHELTPTPVPTLQADSPVYEDDPVAAFGDLARARNDCIRELSVLCLDAVLQQGSAAMADDAAAIRAIERGDGALREQIEPTGVELAERMGDAALISYLQNSEPASVLMVKTEAGWRIRSYLPG